MARKKKNKAVQSNGQSLLKNRELTKPPMIMVSKKKYKRKAKHKNVDF